MKTVKISMVVDSDLAAWGPGAVDEEMEQYQADYEFAAQVVGASIFSDADDVTVEIDFRPTLHNSAYATIVEDDEIVEDDINMDETYEFSARVGEAFYAD